VRDRLTDTAFASVRDVSEVEVSVDQQPTGARSRAGERRRAVSALVGGALDALHAARCGGDRKPAAHALARARAATEVDDGADGRAAAAVRTAWAHLGAGNLEEAFLALESAKSFLAMP
jgi:hypothetical protein